MRNSVKILLSVFLFLSVIWINASAQAPEAINYQGIVRDAAGDVLSYKNLSVKFTILSGSPNGPVEYEETQQVSTNQFGIYDAQIGKGTATGSPFSQIQWNAGNQ